MDRNEYKADDDFYDPPEWYDERVSEVDPYFIEAQKDIVALYESDIERPYYIRQLQVKFERKYFHWITNNAIDGLVKRRCLAESKVRREGGTSTRFVMHRSYRYPKRAIAKMDALILEYSQDHITRSCGLRAEELFCNGLALRGFLPKARKVSAYGGKTWRRSGHNLDFVFEKDNVSYGCEIKNTLGYIDKKELETKLEICGFLNLKPLFIMRYSPKTYNKMIYEAGGFALLFVSQIYDVSQKDLVERMVENLGLPAVCSRAIPEGIMDRFVKWHERGRR